MPKYYGKEGIGVDDENHDKKWLIMLMARRKDKRYRRGMIDCARGFDIITQKEWGELNNQIKNHDSCWMYFET